MYLYICMYVCMCVSVRPKNAAKQHLVVRLKLWKV